jgi:putative acetyltransferase
MMTIRLGVESDQKHLVEWLLQPGVLAGFPLTDIREIEDAARIWVSYSKFGAVLTALWDGVPCGIANLYLQPYKKMSHQCLFAIIVDQNHQKKGIGTKLMEELLKMAKEKFHLQFVHLEVYEGNPAINLYRKLGFEQYGVHPKFIKEGNRYIDKILMQKYL